MKPRVTVIKKMEWHEAQILEIAASGHPTKTRDYTQTLESCKITKNAYTTYTREKGLFKKM